MRTIALVDRKGKVLDPALTIGDKVLILVSTHSLIPTYAESTIESSLYILWTITTQPSLLPYPSQDTVADLRLAVKKASRIHPVRQRLTLPTDNAKA